MHLPIHRSALILGTISLLFCQSAMAKGTSAVCQKSPGTETCIKTLFSIPSRFRLSKLQNGAPMQLLTDASHKQTVFFIANDVEDRQLFINGKYLGVYDRFGVAEPNGAEGVPTVVYGSGDNLFGSNRWPKLGISKDVANQLIDSIGSRDFHVQNLNGDIEKGITLWMEETVKTRKEYFPTLSEAQLRKNIAKELQQTFPVKDLLVKAKKGGLSVTELFELLYYEKTGEWPKFRDVFISRVFNMDEHQSLVFLSFTSSASAIHIQDGKVIGIYNPYAPWASENPAIYHPKTKMLAFRALDPLSSSDAGIWINGKLGKLYNSGVSFPKFSTKGDILYIGVQAEEDESNYKLKCTAVVGTKENDFPCQDILFSRLITNTNSFRFPRVSPDGKTVVYPELVTASEAKDNWLYPEKIFTSRLVVNGKAQEAHPWIDIPYFTNKGLAVVTHSEEGENFVEWNGKRAGPFRSFLPSMASPGDYRGYSKLLLSIYGNSGDKDLPDEVITSPNGMNIAFSAYGTDSKWTVFRDMASVQSYDHVQNLMFSPDSKHLAYVGTNFGKTKSKFTDDLSTTAYVMEDSSLVGTHEKILWMGYSPKDLSLWYVAKDNKNLRVFKNGKAIGTPFDSLVMTPHFLDNGGLELGFVKGRKVAIMKFKAQ